MKNVLAGLMLLSSLQAFSSDIQYGNYRGVISCESADENYFVIVQNHVSGWVKRAVLIMNKGNGEQESRNFVIPFLPKVYNTGSEKLAVFKGDGLTLRLNVKDEEGVELLGPASVELSYQDKVSLVGNDSISIKLKCRSL